VQRLARDELLSNLSLERRAVRSMPRHGSHPPEAQRGVNSNRSICPPPGAHSNDARALIATTTARSSPTWRRTWRRAIATSSG
jgi:hypothetical protein